MDDTGVLKLLYTEDEKNAWKRETKMSEARTLLDAVENLSIEGDGTVGEFFARLADMVEAFDTDDIPLHWAPTAAAVDDLARQGHTYLAAYDMSEQLTVFSSGFQRAIAAVEHETGRARDYTPKTMESIENLVKSVDVNQICTMHDWRTPSGGPDFDKLNEEIAEPGRHRTKDWVPPAEAADRTKWTRLLDVREIQRDQKRQEAADAHEAANKPATESLEDFIREGLHVPQIRKNIPGITDQEIMEEAVRINIFPPSSGQNLSSTRAPRPSERQAIEDAKQEAIGRHATEMAAQEAGLIPDGERESLEDLILNAIGDLPQGTPSEIAKHIGKYGGERIKVKDVKEVMASLEPA